MRAIETTATIDAQHRLLPDEALPIRENTRVRLLVLVPEAQEAGEAEWLHAAAVDPAFDFLRDAEEDIYSAQDGRPFRDEG